MAPSGAIFVDDSVPWNVRQIPLSRPMMALGHQLDAVVGRCSIIENSMAALGLCRPDRYYFPNPLK